MAFRIFIQLCSAKETILEKILELQKSDPWLKNVNSILPPPAPPQPMDPALENIMAINGKPFQAFPGQDHKAHIDAHLSFMSISMVQNNPMAMMSLQKNILEHISLMAQEQIQLEYVDELKELLPINEVP